MGRAIVRHGGRSLRRRLTFAFRLTCGFIRFILVRAAYDTVSTGIKDHAVGRCFRADSFALQTGHESGLNFAMGLDNKIATIGGVSLLLKARAEILNGTER
jgi:hypothetical protein